MNSSDWSGGPTGQREFGRFEFVQESPVVALSSICILGFAGAIGTFGNLLILAAVVRVIPTKSLEFIFVGNLAFSDSIVTLVIDPLNILGKLEGEWIFRALPVVCKGMGYLCTISCVNSLGSIVLMSFSRYVSICHHSVYKRIFNKATCIAMCGSLYLLGLFLVLLNQAGIGDHSFNRKSLECIWDRTYTYMYTLTFTIVLVWFPLLTTGSFYISIFLKFRASSRKVANATSSSHHRKPVSLARTLFLIYAAFAICWIPYAIVMAADRKDTFPYEIHVMVTTFAHLHPSFNWLVLYYTNKLFREAFDSMVKLDKLCLCVCSKKEVRVNECSVITSNITAT